MVTTFSEVTKIRRKVLTAVARLQLNNRLVEEVDKVPGRLIEEGLTNYRCCRHMEKAILRERIILAMGLDPGEIDEDNGPGDIAERLLKLGQSPYEVKPPFIHIIEDACDQCSIDRIIVTNACRNCVAHHCLHSCPKDAISIVADRAFIDRNRCIECGLCVKACSYKAILKIDRPCNRACATGAIIPGNGSAARIDHNKCVECGECISACPFGAISFKSDLFKVIQMLTGKEQDVIGLVAPSYMGQFGSGIEWAGLYNGLRQLGFADIIPVALGADLVIEEESQELLEKVAEKKEREGKNTDTLFNSCCPSFKSLIIKFYDELQNSLSAAESPMIKTARLIKKEKNVKTVFIGPCLAKKREAYSAGKDMVDAVLTFEELTAILVAADINLAKSTNDQGDQGKRYEDNPSLPAINFCQSGGVLKAITDKLSKDIDFKVESVSGIDNCKELLKKIKNGRFEADFVEGMGCSEGCIGGPGTLVTSQVVKRLLKRKKRKE